MKLSFDDSLHLTHRADYEIVRLAARHYSCSNPERTQICPPSEDLLLRDAMAEMVFGWARQLYRADGFGGWLNCFIFRNESPRKSSEIILEAERCAIHKWGPIRAFTYIDPTKIASANPGYCFKQAGWKFLRRSPDGKHILTKVLDFSPTVPQR